MADLAEFRRRVEGYEGRVHEVDGLEAARSRAREIVGDATVARWDDGALDGIAPAEATGVDAAQAELSLIVADVGVADTGQIGFVHGAGRPRGAGVLPPRQIALLARADVVQTVTEALDLFFDFAGDGGHSPPPPANIVLAAGPSHTADIEQRSIRGVHGPGELDVIIY